MIAIILILVVIGVIIYAAKSKENYNVEDIGKIILIVIIVLAVIGFCLFSIATFV